MKKKIGISFILLMMTVFMILAAGFGAKTLSSGAEQYDEYYRLENSAATVTARITSMKEKDDGDGGTDYVTYITYSYNGATFRDVKYKTFGSDDHYGQVVQVEIDPQNPAHLRPDHSGMTQIVFGGIMIAFGVVIATISVTSILSSIKAAKNWQTTYTSPFLNTHVVQMDLDYENHYKKQYSVLITGIISALLLGLLTYNYIETRTLTAPIAYGVTLLVYLGYGAFTYARHNKALEEITLVYDKLLKITTEEDSDGNKTDVWAFACQSRWIPQPRCLVTHTNKTLSSFRVGTEVYLVLNRDNKIERIFDAQEFKM